MLDQSGVDISSDRIKISLAAHLITPVHLLLDGSEETLRGEGSLGTTRRGIGPTYADKASRTGIRAEEMKNVGQFRRRLEEHFRFSTSRFQTGPDLMISEREATLDAYAHYAERLRPYLADTGLLLHTAFQNGEVALAEGAQGTLLDLDYGTYPYVTSSHPTSAGALLGLGIGPEHVRRVIGVTKAFQTRVGEGPFPTELSGEASQRPARHRANNLGMSSAPPQDAPRRCGWLDARSSSAMQAGSTALARSHSPNWTSFPEYHSCTSQPPTSTIMDSPRNTQQIFRLFQKFRPQYEELSGWEEDLTVIREWNDLPKNAQKICGIYRSTERCSCEPHLRGSPNAIRSSSETSENTHSKLQVILAFSHRGNPEQCPPCFRYNAAMFLRRTGVLILIVLGYILVCGRGRMGV